MATDYNVGMNFVLIPHLWGTGAAIATTTSYALEAAIVVGLCVPVIGSIRLHRALVVPALASAVMAAALVAAPSGALAQVAVGVAVHVPVYLALARWIAPEQLAVLRSLLPRRA